MADYIDGFVFPIATIHLDEYKEVAEKIAEVWKEYGALAYNEYICEDSKLEGTRSFPECLDAKEDETIIFGWVVFESKDARDRANKLVAADARIAEIVKPILGPTRIIFNPRRMAFGGFQSFINSQ